MAGGLYERTVDVVVGHWPALASLLRKRRRFWLFEKDVRHNSGATLSYT